MDQNKQQKIVARQDGLLSENTTRPWAPNKTGGDCFFSLYPWCLTYCMIQNRHLINVCWTNNSNYNGTSGRQRFIIMSLTFLSHSLPPHGQSGQRELEGNLSHGTDKKTPIVQTEWVPSHETSQKYRSFGKFRKTSLQRVEFLEVSQLLTDHPLTFITHFISAAQRDGGRSR